MKRFFDLILSIIGIILTSPIILIFSFLIWLKDNQNPIYISNRIGYKGRNFKMYKLRSMIINADKTGVDSTSSNDPRITPTGKFIRKYKLDEFTQFYNILKGDMSFVGPRPNVKRDVDIYTSIEKKLLNVKPGITDFSSIVFSDEADILRGKDDPDIAYNQLIRPWKSRLGLFYIENRNLLIDFTLILITFVNTFSRKLAIFLITKMLVFLKAPEKLINISKRKSLLEPFPPPGSDIIVTSRKH